MPKHATARLEDADLKMKQPASSKEMDHRRQLASLLGSVMDRPVTEAEKEFWREFDAELDKERVTFR
jgi:rubrerythrin